MIGQLDLKRLVTPRLLLIEQHLLQHHFVGNLLRIQTGVVQISPSILQSSRWHASLAKEAAASLVWKCGAARSRVLCLQL